MKTVSIRLTDKQHHYLAAVAKDQMRSVEHLTWLALSQGISYMFCEDTYHVEKLQCDFSFKDGEDLAKYPLTKPSFGDSYYGNHEWADEIRENVLADIEGTLVSADAAFDLQKEINCTAEFHHLREQDHEAKEAAKKEQEAKEAAEQEAAQ